ncbi:hypothetical protein HY469_03745 [Candidatus Roizmanbacteria bacterium]|nr:hypothetical protein [Candidatus Roizmanbacteria bacterium]
MKGGVCMASHDSEYSLGPVLITDIQQTRNDVTFQGEPANEENFLVPSTLSGYDFEPPSNKHSVGDVVMFKYRNGSNGTQEAETTS